MKNKANKCRSLLLKLLSTECNGLVKNLKTKINSISYAEAEQEYSKLLQVIHLQPEMYSPSSTDMGEGIVHTQQSMDRSYCPTIESQTSIDMKTLRIAHRKISIGQKKIDHFNKILVEERKKMNSLSPIKANKKESMLNLNFTYSNQVMNTNDGNVSVLNNLEYINVDSGVLMNENTKKRAETGFRYLQELSQNLKFKKKRKIKKNPNFAEVKKMLCLKENIDPDNIEAYHQKQLRNTVDRRISVPKLKIQRDPLEKELRNQINRSISQGGKNHINLGINFLNLQKCDND